jgi:hypothetical protein
LAALSWCAAAFVCDWLGICVSRLAGEFPVDHQQPQ